MNFINEDNIVELNTYGSPIVKVYPKGIPSTEVMCLKNFDKNLYVWGCVITTETSLKIFDIRNLMGEQTFNDILHGQVSLLIGIPFEPFLSCIDSIYENVIIKHGIPAEKVIFVSNMVDAYEYNISVAAKFELNPIRVIWIPTLEFALWLRAKQDPTLHIETLAIKKYKKKFLNFNRRWRQHRPLLTLLLHDKKLLDQGFISLAPCEMNSVWWKVLNKLKEDALDNKEMLDIILRNEEIVNLPPMLLDTTELHTNRAEATNSTNIFYKESYFSVVSETTFYYKDSLTNSRFLSEKTFKPILFKHPFILVTVPKSLRVLKKLGYRTFSPFIDESYDEEVNDNVRMLLIAKEIERLCNLTETELETFLISVKEICEHNYNTLLGKTNFTYEGVTIDDEQYFMKF